jgi:hypothetical protein
VRNAKHGRVLVLLLALVAGSFFVAPAASAASADGRNVGVSFNGDLIGLSSARIRSDFTTARDMGATWVRIPMNWSTLEMHGKGQYNWGPGDNAVRIANSVGLKVDAVVSYAPGWARPAGSPNITPPTKASDYGDFLAAATAHYAPMGVRTWEIWNEPNLFTMWYPRPDVVKYTSLLKAAYPRIKAVDPSATVLTGGTSPAADFTDGSGKLPLTFLRGIYTNGGKGYFDGVAHHPSTFPYSITASGDWNSFQQSKDLYAEMVAHGDGAKKVWATEIGWPTGTSNRSVSETVQGLRFAEALNAWANWSFTGPAFVYTVRNAGTDPADHYQNFGIAMADGTRKDSWGIIRQALRAPRDVRATATGAGATVTWSAPTYDYGTPITQYDVVAFPTGKTATVPGTARSASLALPAGNAYRFIVQPIQQGWPGIVSAPTTPVTPNGVKVSPGLGRTLEGDSGTKTLLVPVRLNKTSPQTVTVDYTTARFAPEFNAAAPQDYDATSGTVTFAPGQKTKYVSVTIKGETVVEPDDKFLVVFSNAHNATLAGYGGLGFGVIQNDD